MSNADRMIKISEVMEKLGVSRAQVYKMIKTKGFPKPVSLGHASARWIESEVNAWINERKELRNAA